MMAGEKFTDQEVAYMVPMLLRDQIDHEAVCVIARDRIEALVRDRADLRAKLEALADTYAASATAAERRLREVVIAREAAEAENDKLRLLLAASKADCAYCGLPSDRMAECASGFPGCARADDMIADGTPTRAEMNDECDRLRAELSAMTNRRVDWGGEAMKAWMLIQNGEPYTRWIFDTRKEAREFFLDNVPTDVRNVRIVRVEIKEITKCTTT